MFFYKKNKKMQDIEFLVSVFFVDCITVDEESSEKSSAVATLQSVVQKNGQHVSFRAATAFTIGQLKMSEAPCKQLV